MAREVERRWLVISRPVPAPKPLPVREVIQIYTMIDDDSNREQRIRRQKQDGKYTFEWTEKHGQGIDRDELTAPATAADYESLKREAMVGRPIIKDVYLHKTPGQPTIEVHVFHGHLIGHAHIEVEFPDLASAQAYTVPPWFGREVTDDVRYNGRNLCRYGLPKEER